MSQLLEEILKEAERWIATQFTLADPNDQRNQKDAQARIELVDHLRERFSPND